MRVERDPLWPQQQHPSAYFYVAYPIWVRALQRVREKISKWVFYCEMKTARFYDPRTGEPIERVR